MTQVHKKQASKRMIKRAIRRFEWFGVIACAAIVSGLTIAILVTITN